ncbi:MAG: hypothetical protein A2804_02665 [Candidatus Pacebacteria bacterium RIFCSPHIGHO2_01_FULL_46_10]|nr:MAG: hypothetical protein A2804_02665 [Candidatus Pacebacteria bacterium RIFCSPHIGHO2_01_FULL_46_10]
MPIFTYKVKLQSGETAKGKVEAQNGAQAAALLKEKGFFIISVEEASGALFKSLQTALDHVTPKDIVGFTRQLSTMVTAGLTLTEAFVILEQQSRPVMQKVISALRRDVEGGSSFADALKKQSNLFSKVYIALIRSGEAAGVLDQILKRLADSLEKQSEFASKTKGALVYPVIVVTAMVAVTIVMMVFVIPKLTAMYQDFGAELPGVTKALISTSNFFTKYWYGMIFTIGGTIYGLKRWKKTPYGEQMIDGWILKVPVFGTLKVKVMMADFTRTVSLLLGAGVSLLSTLQIVGESLDNAMYRLALKDVAGDVEKGVSFAEALSRRELFPPLVSQMASVGEETGKLDEVLLKVSSYFETESEQAVKNLSTALEPLIMVFLGIGVGFLMIAIVMPIYNLTSQF